MKQERLEEIERLIPRKNSGNYDSVPWWDINELTTAVQDLLAEVERLQDKLESQQKREMRRQRETMEETNKIKQSLGLPEQEENCPVCFEHKHNCFCHYGLKMGWGKHEQQ